MRKSSNNFDTDNSGGELFPLSPVNDKKIEASFTSPYLSSQGGLLLMREVEQKNGFISQLADCIEDTRYQPFVEHSYYEMLMQRIYQISEGNLYGQSSGRYGVWICVDPIGTTHLSISPTLPEHQTAGSNPSDRLCPEDKP